MSENDNKIEEGKTGGTGNGAGTGASTGAPAVTEAEKENETGKKPAAAPKQEEKPLKRVFVYDGREYEDPDPELSIDTVKEAMVMSLPELANSTYKKTKRGDGTLAVEFEKVSGGKN